jgi:hypothetical protein
VTLLLPLQSPSRVPVIGSDTAPAKLMSEKSISDSAETAAQESVRWVPIALDSKDVLQTAVVPAPTVKVPVIV